MMQWHSTPSWGKIFKEAYTIEGPMDVLKAIVFTALLISLVVGFIVAAWPVALVIGGTYGIFWVLSFFFNVEEESKPEAQAIVNEQDEFSDSLSTMLNGKPKTDAERDELKRKMVEHLTKGVTH